MKKSLLVMAFCAMAATGVAQAETVTTNSATPATENSSAKRYIGISFGSTKSTYLEDEVGDIIPQSAFDNKEIGAKIFFGIKTDSPYFDARFSLVRLGKFQAYLFQHTGPGSSTTFDASIEATGIYADGLLKFPFASNRASLFAKLGLGYASVKQNVMGQVISGGTTTFYDSFSETDVGLSFTAGFGVNFDISKHFGIQLEAERYFVGIKEDQNSDDTTTAKIDMASVGVYYRF